MIQWRLASLVHVALFVAFCLPVLPILQALDASTAAALLNRTIVKEEVEALLKEGDHVYEESHHSLLPLEPSDYVGLFCCLAGLLLAAGGGIGGGRILIPIYILVMGFSPKHTISLLNVTVLGGAIANMMLNARQRHPDPKVDRPLVDWYLILIMEPVTIAGTILEHGSTVF